MDVNANLSTRTLVLAVLQVIVGGTVILGGAALVYFSADSTGQILGTVHATLGLTGFAAGILLWTRKVGARALTIWANALIIAFSTASEAVLSITGSLPGTAFADSIVGTTVAVVVAIPVILLLMRPEVKTSLGDGRGQSLNARGESR